MMSEDQPVGAWQYRIGDTYINRDGSQSVIKSIFGPYTRGHSYPTAVCENGDVIINGKK